MIHDFDQTLVMVRPKHYVGSSGSTWASDYLHLRWTLPQMFEKSSDMQLYSIQLRGFASRMHDILSYFTDVTNQEDLDCMTDNSACKFRSYEEVKLAWLEKQIIFAENQFREERAPNTSTHESNAVEKLFKDISSIKSKIADALKCFKGKEKREHLIRTYNVITASCKFLLTSIDQIDLTPVFPVIFKETDAGPGVGVSNIEMRYRDVELARCKVRVLSFVRIMVLMIRE